MHSVELPATISCRSQATTTARCRLRGRMHLPGSPSSGLTPAQPQPPTPRDPPAHPREAAGAEQTLAKAQGAGGAWVGMAQGRGGLVGRPLTKPSAWAEIGCCC